MRLSAELQRTYEREGWLLLPALLDATETALLCRTVVEEAARDSPGRVLERDGELVRALHGCHRGNAVFERLTRDPRLLEPARQLVGDEVYVHQFKVNLKVAFGGDVWPWHQDFIFWAREDGMLAPRVANIAVFLDEVTEFNGPMLLLPGSHGEGLIDVPPRSTRSQGERSWEANVSADLKYTLDRVTVGRLARRHGIVAPKGPPGSVLLFHSNLAHASGPNLSPVDRRLLIVSYNAAGNRLPASDAPRPDFLVDREGPVLEPLAEGERLGPA